jgi:hypothetical protein
VLSRPRRSWWSAATTLALATAAALSPGSAAASAPGACHCYRDRSFDPARPAAADDYILATAKSSLLSAALGPPKRELVEAVMTGTSADDLWIAHWAAARTGRSASALLDAKGEAGSWKAVLGAGGVPRPFAEALARGAGDAELAALAVDDVLATRLRADPAALRALRREGAGSSELVLAVALAARLGTEAATVLAPIRAGRATWGVVLTGLGLTPKELDPLVRQLVTRGE